MPGRIRKIPALLFCLMLPASVNASVDASVAKSSVRPVELVRDSDIEDARKLGVEVDRLTAKVRQCAAAGLALPSKCYCYYPNRLASAKGLYQRVLAKHPDWENRAVLWWNRDRTYPSNLHFGGLKVQFSQNCSEST